jgi:hypothetical protein
MFIHYLGQIKTVYLWFAKCQLIDSDSVASDLRIHNGFFFKNQLIFAVTGERVKVSI